MYVIRVLGQVLHVLRELVAVQLRLVELLVELALLPPPEQTNAQSREQQDAERDRDRAFCLLPHGRSSSARSTLVMTNTPIPRTRRTAASTSTRGSPRR